MLKIRRPLGRLIFNMGIAIPGKTVFLIETAPSGLLAPNANLMTLQFAPNWYAISSDSDDEVINYDNEKSLEWGELHQI